MSKLDDIFETLRYTVLNRQVKEGEWQSEVWIEVTGKPKQQIKELFKDLTRNYRNEHELIEEIDKL